MIDARAKFHRNPRRWLRLYLLSNCFGKPKSHLGLYWKGHWYCITHNDQGYKLEIPKKYLDMREYSEKPEYLTRLTDVPTVLNPTNMSISKTILYKYLKKYG